MSLDDAEGRRTSYSLVPTRSLARLCLQQARDNARGQIAMTIVSSIKSIRFLRCLNLPRPLAAGEVTSAHSNASRVCLDDLGRRCLFAAPTGTPELSHRGITKAYEPCN
jgi:hypothetical protein